MKDLWKFIIEKCNSNIQLILLIVIDNDGSSPGQAGFKMAVAADGTMTGSIGGGQSEYRIVEKAKRELMEGNSQISLIREIHRPDAEEDRSGMICSGEQWVAFYPITSKDQHTCKNILSALDEAKDGMIHYNQDGFVFNPGEKNRHKHQNPVTSPNEWIFSESIGKMKQLYIFGAGHVGLALSDIASKLGFTIHIFDNRENINTMTVNEYAQFKKVIDYAHSVELVPDGDHIYVVIMTFAHQSDEIVLRQFLGKNIKYLGMMGSHKKVETIFKNLENEGFERHDLNNIHAPIGIEIPSQTPYEIAISIVAEMISAKND